MRLLVVDDDVTVRMLLSMALVGDEIVEHWRLLDVVDVAVERDVDAVVIDRRLPDGDGLHAVRALRTDPRTADVPIVVITADDDPVQRRWAFAVGADEHVAKPFSPEALLDIAQRIAATPVDQRRLRRTLHRARFHVGRHDGGLEDLLASEIPPELPAMAPRRRRRLLTKSRS